MLSCTSISWRNIAVRVSSPGCGRASGRGAVQVSGVCASSDSRASTPAAMMATVSRATIGASCSTSMAASATLTASAAAPAMTTRPTHTLLACTLMSRPSGRDPRGCPPAPARPGCGHRQAARGWRSAPRGRASRAPPPGADRRRALCRKRTTSSVAVSEGRRGIPTFAAVSSSSTQQATMPLRTSESASAASYSSRSRRIASRPASATDSGSRSSTSCLSGSSRASRATTRRTAPATSQRPRSSRARKKRSRSQSPRPVSSLVKGRLSVADVHGRGGGVRLFRHGLRGVSRPPTGSRSLPRGRCWRPAPSRERPRAPPPRR